MPTSFWKYRRTTGQILSRNDTVDASLRSPFGEEVDEAIKQHALEEYPNECCGIIVDGVYRRCANVHADPQNHFEVDRRTLQTFASQIEAVCHSHTQEIVWPSYDDMKRQEMMDIPWSITTVVDNDGEPFVLDHFWFGDDLEALPWEGRIFRPGIQDCFSLVRDCLRQQGCDVPVMPREQGWWEDKNGEKRQDLFNDLLEPSGFKRISVQDLREWDGFACMIGAPVLNHCGIVLPGDKILHHQLGHKSEIVNAFRWVRRAREGGAFFRWKGFDK